MLICVGPHQTNIGKRELRQILTAISRLCGQLSIGPRGVADQSKSRTRCAISLWATPSRSGFLLTGLRRVMIRALRADGCHDVPESAVALRRPVSSGIGSLGTGS